MNQENKIRERIVEIGLSLYRRGLSPGSSGNISARVEDGWILTPTNSCLGELDPSTLAKLDWNGKHLSGAKPSKEYFLHLAMYDSRAESGAIVHLHSSYAAAVSCLEEAWRQSARVGNCQTRFSARGCPASEPRPGCFRERARFRHVRRRRVGGDREADVVSSWTQDSNLKGKPDPGVEGNLWRHVVKIRNRECTRIDTKCADLIRVHWRLFVVRKI
jgi:hypothetical protein